MLFPPTHIATAQSLVQTGQCPHSEERSSVPKKKTIGKQTTRKPEPSSGGVSRDIHAQIPSNCLEVRHGPSYLKAAFLVDEVTHQCADGLENLAVPTHIHAMTLSHRAWIAFGANATRRPFGGISTSIRCPGIRWHAILAHLVSFQLSAQHRNQLIHLQPSVVVVLWLASDSFRDIVDQPASLAYPVLVHTREFPIMRVCRLLTLTTPAPLFVHVVHCGAPRASHKQMI